MTALKSYPSYRKTDLPWLGQIPTHWEVKRLKQVADVAFSSVDKHTHEDEKPVLLSNYVDVYKNEQITGELEFMKATASDDEIKRFTLRNNDVMITKDSESWNDIAIPAYVPNDLENVLCGYHLALIRPNPSEIDGKFLFRALQSKIINYQFEVEATGITRYGIDQYAIGSAFFPTPPLPEQQAIAAYLDRQTVKIDTLIAKKQRLLDLLAEQRAAIISQAVTKGLNPDVKMKDSDRAWLGHVPSHWKVGKLGSRASVKARLGWKGLKASEYVNDGFIFLSTPNIKDREIDFVNVNFITGQRYFESPEIMVQEGDVLLAKDGSTLGTVNVVRKLPAPTTVNSSVAVLRSKGTLSSIFFYYFLRSHYVRNIIQQMKDGMGVPHLFQADIRKFTILVPPISEQIEIAFYLDRETAKVEGLINKVETAIERLREYRSALISSAVTGKVDVRENQ